MRKIIKTVALLMVAVSMIFSLSITASAASRGKTDNADSYSRNGVFIVSVLKGAVAGGIVYLIMLPFHKKKPSGDAKTPPKPPVNPTPPVKSGESPNPDNMETIPVNIPNTEPQRQGIFLFCLDGVLKGRSYPIGSGPVIIGRYPTCDVPYPADVGGVSRNHCKIEHQGDELLITDLKSSYGTFINGNVRLEANKATSLHDGDIIYIGSKENAFKVKIG